MGQGLLINLNDGGPVMEITAGLRCPSYSGGWSDSSPVSLSTAISNYVAGSEVFLVPRVCASYSPPMSPDIIGSVSCLTGYSVSGSTLTQKVFSTDVRYTPKTGFNSAIFQVLPAGAVGSGGGLYIQDSTDFTAIPVSTMAGFCIWRGTVTFTKSWTLPATAFPKANYMVFGKWSAPGVTIECDGNVIEAYVDKNSSSDEPATVTMQIAIFASGIAPTPGPGLNMFKNGACVFSTTRRPFVYRGVKWTPSWTETDIGNTMVLLCNYGYDSSLSGGWDNLKLAGVVRSGNRIKCGRGKIRGSWTDKYPVTGQRLAAITLPCIEAMY